MLTARISQEGPRVILDLDGKCVTMSWDEALALGQGIVTQARKAEEIAKADQVISDGALLFRSGAPIGITDNPEMQKEIVKEAINNRDLRRSGLTGVKSEEILGTPTLKQLRPNATPAERVAAMSEREKAKYRLTLSLRSNGNGK